jgi:hypothetical protein
MYDAVRERATELRVTGWRVDQALMAIKREVASCAVRANGENGADAEQIAALLNAVVRCCVGPYYMAEWKADLRGTGAGHGGGVPHWRHWEPIRSAVAAHRYPHRRNGNAYRLIRIGERSRWR